MPAQSESKRRRARAALPTRKGSSLALPEQRFVHHAELPFQGRDSRAWERDSHHVPLVVTRWLDQVKGNVAGLVAGAVAARVLPQLR